MVPVLPFLPLLNILGIGGLINGIFGEQAIIRAQVNEDQKIALIMAIKHCSESTAKRYYQTYLNEHMNDGTLQNQVDISKDEGEN